ncbi:MarR family winged helix-turn-helix transcriptional regulator [Sciscionella marina]|uniref:MarR family winged helix-turn-helix transcriptional regulator n=1 Tax=Sciscionella marina TaxID=508770 RepID=UPI000365BD2C|nr:MarR family transcriptional regulator [Sciscionella marina]
MTFAESSGAPVPTEEELRLADSIGMAMARLGRMSAAAQAKASANGGLERSAFMLLIELAKNGPCRSSALAELVFVDQSTVSRQVAGLVTDGLVERRADPSDGRVSMLGITGQGIELLEQHRERRNRSIASVVAHWPQAQRERFAELFDQFTADYEQRMPELLEAFVQQVNQQAERR